MSLHEECFIWNLWLLQKTKKTRGRFDYGVVVILTSLSRVLLHIAQHILQILAFSLCSENRLNSGFIPAFVEATFGSLLLLADVCVARVRKQNNLHPVSNVTAPPSLFDWQVICGQCSAGTTRRLEQSNIEMSQCSVIRASVFTFHTAFYFTTSQNYFTVYKLHILQTKETWNVINSSSISTAETWVN